MTKTLCLFISLVLCGAAFSAPEPPPVLAPSGVLVDAATGRVLWAHNPDERRPMASTTKMMTALLILESGRLGEVCTVSPDAAKVEESSLNLKPGEHLTLEDLLRGILLRSANDACVAAAEHLDGSVGAFVARMNARAAALGCRNTRFRNPNGLNAEGHYSSARDLSIIARAALAYPLFRDIVRAPHYTIERDINRYDRTLTARDHWFLTHYPGADGIKTGYTHQAGHCFVGSATRNGFQLISVLMHSPNIKKETCALLDWGYRNFRGGLAVKPGRTLGDVRVEGGSLDEVPVGAAAPVFVVVPRTAGPVRPDLSALHVWAPVRVGQRLGAAPLVSDGSVVGSADIVATADVGVSLLRKVERGAAGLAVLGLGGGLLGATAKANRRRRRRLAARRRGLDPIRPGVREREDSLYR